MTIDSAVEAREREAEDEMMESAQKRPVDTEQWALRGVASASVADAPAAERVVSFQPMPVDNDLLSSDSPLRRRDWSSALDLVEEACEAIRIRDERVDELEREAVQFAAQMREEMKLYQAQLQAAQRQIQQAEARAEKAEARATEAETWLARLDEAIKSGFGRIAGSGPVGL